MIILKALNRLHGLPGPTAVAIGNFDGLHLGHQAILRLLVERAAASHLLSLVLTFSPHPEKILGGEKVRMIQTLAQRLAGLRRLGVGAVLVASFDRTFSRMTSRQFFEDILLSRLQAKEIIIGLDFRFGLNRQGDVEELRRLGAERDVSVHSVPPVQVGGKTVSSSLIRSLLEGGDVEEARLLLGRPYEIEGKVGPGSARGKSLGFPTANILTKNEITPPGVFITEAVLGKEIFPSVTNIGFRPTFNQDFLQVEAFLFDFQQSIYGRRIRLRFLRKIRDEKKFASPELLVHQIRQDVEVAREYFENQGQRMRS